MTYPSLPRPRNGTLAGLAALVVALVALLILAEPSLASPAANNAGGNPVGEMFHNLRRVVEGAGKDAWLVALILGSIGVLILTRGSMPKLVAFLIVMAILAPVVNNAGGIGNTLTSMGESIWPGGSSGSGGSKGP